MAKINQIRRLAIIINKLSGINKYIPTEELINSVTQTIRIRYSDAAGCTLRTLQRDFQTIEELFDIVIRHDKSRGYYIAERYGSAENYESLLLNFELLSQIDANSTLQKYVIAEHRKPTFNADISELLEAIREQHPIEFDYTLVRHDNRVIHKRILPHFLKESQQRWYLVGYDEDTKLKAFGLDRMAAIRIIYSRRFERNDSIDIAASFRESYGIWNNPQDPIEEIVLKYDSLDGAFVKSLPLHSTQEVLADTPEGVTIRLRLRITNDFVMALLARSRSLEVVKPLLLRQRIHDTYQQALERNKLSDDEK